MIECGVSASHANLLSELSVSALRPSTDMVLPRIGRPLRVAGSPYDVA